MDDFLAWQQAMLQNRQLVRDAMNRTTPIDLHGRTGGWQSDSRYWGGPTKGEYNSALRKQEIKALETLMHQGWCEQLQMQIDDKGRLAVYGQEYNGANLLFVVNTIANTMAALSKRVPHIRKQLTTLAEREEYELTIGDKQPHFGKGIGVAYWAFRKNGQLDDSELVGHTKLVDVPSNEEPADSPRRATVDEYIQYVVSDSQNIFDEYIRLRPSQQLRPPQQVQQMQERQSREYSRNGYISIDGPPF